MHLYKFGKTVTYWLVRTLFSVSYEGLENIPPKEHGYILASNHRTNFDPLFIAHKVNGSLRFMAKIELFSNPFKSYIMHGIGAFPVDRGSGDDSAMDCAKHIIQNGGKLAMFPEGHRSKDGKPLRARNGIGMIAAATGADVLPCAVCFGKKLGFRSKVLVRYGDLIPAQKLEETGNIRNSSKYIMSKIVKMLEQSGGIPDIGGEET